MPDDPKCPICGSELNRPHEGGDEPDWECRNLDCEFYLPWRLDISARDAMKLIAAQPDPRAFFDLICPPDRP